MPVTRPAKNTTPSRAGFTAFYLEGLASTSQPWENQPGLLSCGERQNDSSVPPFMQLTYEHSVTNLQVQLGEEEFRAVWNQGQMMTIELVVKAGKPAERFDIMAPIRSGEERYEAKCMLPTEVCFSNFCAFFQSNFSFTSGLK